MSFPLAGNKNVRIAIENAISSNRLPHAILIEGDEGLGKRTLARYIAQAAICCGEDAPCNDCKHCRLCQSSSHPDISFIEPEENKKNISVKQLRELRNDTFVKPHSAKRRVFIIPQVHRLNESGQNVLLKTLEEPPAGAMFILLVPSRTVLLDTIISRCAVFSLSAPKRQEALECLMNLSKADQDTATAALEACQNNIGKALLMIDKKANDKAGDAAREFLQLALSGSEYDMLKLLVPFEKNRILAEEFFRALQLEIAKQLRTAAKNSVKARALDTYFDETKRYLQLLNTNINLSLLFSAAVSRIKMLLI